MSLLLCALLLRKLQFPLMAPWVGHLPFSTLLFAGYLQNCFFPRGQEAPERVHPSQAAVLRWALLSLHLKVCDKEMRPIPGQTREYGHSLMTLPIPSTLCLYLHACEWCLDDITVFAWAKQWLSCVPGNCCAASFSYWLGTGPQTRGLLTPAMLVMAISLVPLLPFHCSGTLR